MKIREQRMPLELVQKTPTRSTCQSRRTPISTFSLERNTLRRTRLLSYMPSATQSPPASLPPRTWSGKYFSFNLALSLCFIQSTCTHLSIFCPTHYTSWATRYSDSFIKTDLVFSWKAKALRCLINLVIQLISNCVRYQERNLDKSVALYFLGGLFRKFELNNISAGSPGLKKSGLFQ